MPQIILVGVDGSDSSRRAAQVAAELASSTGATLYVMTAIDEKVRTNLGEDHYVGDVRLATTPGDQAEAIARDVANELTGIVANIQTSPARGKPAEALVTVAQDLRADLIVVGNRRVQGLGRILGSVATDVAHHAPCDVYIVKTV